MASFWGTFNKVEGRAKATTMPVMRGANAEGLTVLTTSGSSQIVQRSAADWKAPNHGFLTVRASVAVWIHIDASPTAVAATDWYIPADETRDFSVEPGEKIAVINA